MGKIREFNGALEQVYTMVTLAQCLSVQAAFTTGKAT